MGTQIEPVDLLRRLGDEYHHLEQEHRRQPSESATRRGLDKKLRDIKDHFEHLLAGWVAEPALRERWRDFLRGAAGAPDGPHLRPPPLFKGRTEAGTVVEILPEANGYTVFVDGQRVDCDDVPWQLEPDMRGRVQIREHVCEEAFDAPEEAVRALDEFLTGRAKPPWPWARELIEDGLIDSQLSLTPRGRRCLDRGRPVEAPAVRANNACVLVADAVRARVFVLDATRDAVGPTITELVELAEIKNPIARASDSEVLSDSRPGLRREAPQGPRHGVSDHREDRRRELERQFAVRIAEEAAGVWRRYPACDVIVAASPRMLGFLRHAIERQVRPKDQIELHELPRELTQLSAAMLHDLLAKEELLPERGRRPPLMPVPGLPK
jgi:protein required for attachment to host cells